jgi:hypothetical protein
MKHTSLHHHRPWLLRWSLAVSAAVPVSASAFSQTFYENRFNDTKGLEFKGGAAIGADGSGVSGKPGDKSYTADASTLAADQPSSAALITGGPAPLSADEVTVTVWYKPHGLVNDAATLFRAFVGQLMWEGKRNE